MGFLLFFFFKCSVLFKEINDIEIPITFIKNVLKKPMISYILYLGVNCVTKKYEFNLETTGDLAFFPNRKSVPLRIRG